MSIGDRIKSRRKELGMSAEELAERIGKSAATIYRYEKGDISKVDSEILMPIADALQTSPAYLMGWDSEELKERLEKMRGITSPSAKNLQNLGKALEIYVPRDDAENELMSIYRHLNEKGRDMLINTARSYAANPDLNKDGASNTAMV